MEQSLINANRKLFNTSVFIYEILFETEKSPDIAYICNYKDVDNNKINYNGNIYEPYPVKTDIISNSITGSGSGTKLSLSNLKGRFNILLQNVTEFKAGRVSIKQLNFKALFPQTKEQIEYLTSNDVPTVLYNGEFHISGIDSYDGDLLVLKLRSFKDTNLMIPSKTIDINCIYDFKDINCKYSGDEKQCNKSYQRCKELSNTINFGGVNGANN